FDGYGLPYQYITVAEFDKYPPDDIVPYWSLQMVDAPADLIYMSDSSGILRWEYAEDYPLGDYIYDVSCTCADNTITKRTTIHLQESPVGSPDGISFPDEIIVPLGESISETASILPDDWSLPGFNLYWNVNDVLFHGEWFEPSENDYLLVSANNQGQYTFTGITAGRYMVEIAANVSYLSFSKTVPIIVLNEDGSEPDAAFSFSLPDEVTVYKFDGYHLSDRRITGAEFDKYPSEGFAPGWSLKMVDAPADLIYMSDSPVILRWKYSEDYPLGDYIYDVSCIWNDEVITKRISIHLQESPVRLPDGISFPDKIIVPLGESISETASLLPDGWSLPGFNLYWNVNDAFVRGEWFDPSENDCLLVSAGDHGQYTFTGIAAGRYMVEMTVNVSYLSFSKAVPVIVLREDGSEPDPGFSFSLPDEITVYKLNDWHLSSNKITEAEIDNYQSGAYAPVWSLQMVDAPANMVRIWGTSSSAELSWIYARAFPVGDYIYDVSCTWNAGTVTKRITIHLQDSPVGAPTGISFPDKLTIPLGETVTETASIMPSGWSLPGWSFDWRGTCYLDRRYLNPSDNDYLVFSSDQDGHYSFLGKTPGVYVVNLEASSNSYFLSKGDIYVTVLNADGTKPEVQFELNLAEEETTVYRIKDDLRELYGLPSVSAKYGGSPADLQWSLLPVSVPQDAIHIAYGYDTTIVLNWSEAYPPAGDYIYEVSCTADERSLSKRFTVHLLDCPDGVPELSFPESITLRVGETITESAHILPEGWRVPDGLNLHWNNPSVNWGSTAAGGENSFLRVIVDDGVYTMTGLEAGYYSIFLSFSIDSLSVYKEIPVLVLNEDGSEPVADYDINVPETLYAYRSADLHLARFEVVADDSYTHTWEWTIQPVSVPEDAIYNGKPYSEDLAPFLDLFWRSDTAPAGDYVYDISCRNDLILVTKRITIHLLDEEPELPSLDSITASKTGSDLEIALHVSGGMPTQVAFDVYQGLDNSLYNHIEAHTASAPALVKDIPDGLYQIVVTLKNPAGSVTRATEFYRISSGKLTAVDGTLTLPASLTCIEEEAFAGIQSSTVICPSTLKEIGAGAFQGSTVTRIEIPASVTSIADTAFSGCSKYLAVVTPSGSTAASWAMEHGYLVELQ
ncbi:MAG: leucine-rich repeat domain-containing protein, partial [Clostridia bacterium]|nr:leucine-rich repeat domain-containing protein [Clostridia bacterium]